MHSNKLGKCADTKKMCRCAKRLTACGKGGVISPFKKWLPHRSWQALIIAGKAGIVSPIGASQALLIKAATIPWTKLRCFRRWCIHACSWITRRLVHRVGFRGSHIVWQCVVKSSAFYMCMCLSCMTSVADPGSILGGGDHQEVHYRSFKWTPHMNWPHLHGYTTGLTYVVLWNGINY